MSSADCCQESSKTVIREDKTKLVARLNRISGQVSGITRMVEEDRYCVDILTQIAAARSALEGVAMQLLENHARGCVASAIRTGEGDAAIAELLDIIKRL